MEKIVEKIAHWSKVFNLPVKEETEIEYTDRIKLGLSLIREETDELEEALINNDKKEVFDASGDLQWVVLRLLMDLGVYNKLDEIIECIYKSNMSKACYSQTEAEESCFAYGEQGIMTYYKKKENEDIWIVYRTADNKVLKSTNFKEPDFSSILNK